MARHPGHRRGDGRRGCRGPARTGGHCLGVCHGFRGWGRASSRLLSEPRTRAPSASARTRVVRVVRRLRGSARVWGSSTGLPCAVTRGTAWGAVTRRTAWGGRRPWRPVRAEPGIGLRPTACRQRFLYVAVTSTSTSQPFTASDATSMVALAGRALLVSRGAFAGDVPIGTGTASWDFRSTLAKYCR